MAGQGAVLGWRRFAFHNMHLEGGEHLLARGASGLLIVLGYVALGVAVLGRDLLSALVGEAFLSGAIVVPVLACAVLLYQAQAIFRIGLLKKKQTGAVSGIAAAAVVLNLVLNFVLIPWYGMLGAAWATLLAQFAHVLLTLRYSQRAYGVPFEWGRMAAALAWFAAALAAAELLAPVGATARVAVRLGILTGCAPATAGQRSRQDAATGRAAGLA